MNAFLHKENTRMFNCIFRKALINVTHTTWHLFNLQNSMSKRLKINILLLIKSKI